MTNLPFPHPFSVRSHDRLCAVCNLPAYDHANANAEPPDKVLDLRVRVPYGYEIKHITAVNGDNSIGTMCDIIHEKPAGDELAIKLTAQTVKSLRDEIESGRRGLVYRLDKQAEQISRQDARIAKMSEEHANDVAATDLRMDRLSAKIGDLFDQIDSLRGWAEKHEHPAPAKRTIKGGWLNVWANPTADRVVGPIVFNSRFEADRSARIDSGTRIACIKIPDFTEGEGL